MEHFKIKIEYFLTLIMLGVSIRVL